MTVHACESCKRKIATIRMMFGDGEWFSVCPECLDQARFGLVPFVWEVL